MHATPEGLSKSRWASHVDAHKTIPPLPELPAGEYLLDALHEVGAFSQGSMGGISPLTWLELDAYCRRTGEVENPWEAKLIIELSREYVSGYNIGLNVLGIPPYGEESGPIISGGVFARLKAGAKNG